MRHLIVSLLLLTHFPAWGIGFANGVKIGEVTNSSAVIWVRLTAHSEASNKVAKWNDEQPWQWNVPGARGAVGLVGPYVEGPNKGEPHEWITVDSETDYCHQFQVQNLKPSTSYVFEVKGRGENGKLTTLKGAFRTAPSPDSNASVTFVTSTCQDFPRRDNPQNGHNIYKSMLTLDPMFFVQTGDTIYYDKPNPYAKDMATARYKWNRFYALPYQREFHRTVPSYWLHDDHDVLKNDCWPGQTYGNLTWEQGLKIWREQIPQSSKPYRTFRWGKHLQVWFPEGREYRSPNTMKDGPDKTILGKEQWKWLETTMKESDATFKLFISATPVVGPDRQNKSDNHANKGYRTEGQRLRKFLSSISGCIVLNGDRHWQYHSIDPETGLNEFGSGAASDQHAGGWSQEHKVDWQKFVRVKGGFLSVTVNKSEATFRHHDVHGVEKNVVVIPAPNAR
ncbi:hypothetical protein Rhal01_02747 [Rubritalea halochordaticola]|uniref:PhoD-like phosphatase metallophosphatase domain-containing protein n=2 Tax=Rubritalea halochordaticola TaxID=714537 RepID=A0ABP9V1J0_9BACT